MNSSDPSETTNPPSNQRGGEFRKKGFKIFGLDLQDFIKFFFSGNASLAIVILILICVFLAREAALFFPDHHKGLKAYRQSGQELVDFVGEEVNAFTALYSSSNIAYYAELNESSLEQDNLLAAYRSVLSLVKNETSRVRDRLEDKLDDLEDAQDDLVDAREDLAKFDPVNDSEKVEKLKGKIEKYTKEIESLKPDIAVLEPELKKESEAILNNSLTWKFDNSDLKLTKTQIKNFREAVLYAVPNAEGEHPYIEELKKVSAAKKSVAAEKLVDFKATVTGLRDSAKEVKSLHSEMKKIASLAKREAEKFETAPGRRAALLAGAKLEKDPEAKARKIERAEAVMVEEPDFAALTKPLYDKIPEHEKLARKFEKEVEVLASQLPRKVSTKSATANLKEARKAQKRFESTVKSSLDKIDDWRHDKAYSIVGSISAFIFGRDWVTNSSWHDFYGLLPLFTGSFMISIIALVVAVPFAVSAAIYVNQLAPVKEQNFVKPAIEFIEAIPSVVLGFFGIFVLGTALRNLSQVPWLEWVPGFPMSERLTILNAGLLLAFMAMPTIFTLAEDALNNVPKAFSENSLALGASKLQTVLQVVFPTALSGIIAAALLGFGRIIGETMVVLLVAGNKIKIPDFSEGLGVVAQPAHTMTGIIAQELGEVDNGSLHWRALFMVGMVLFFISLLVNFSAQKILQRFQKI